MVATTGGEPLPNTPGIGGYLLAWLVSVVLFSGYLAVRVMVTETNASAGLGATLAAMVVYGGYALYFSIPFAVVGMALVHLTCFRIRAQWVHVLAAGVAGMIPTALMIGLDSQAELWLWWMIPVATAIGRWSVVPLVRRNRLSRGAPAAS